MPRGKKATTPAGYDAQKVASVPGQRYGEGVEQQQLQQAMPAADLQASPITVPGAAAPPGQPGQGPPPDLGALMAQIPAGMLGGTQLPNQPVTAGLSSGPGAGPEVLNMRASTQMRRMLDELSRRSGDPYFTQLADRARL